MPGRIQSIQRAAAILRRLAAPPRQRGVAELAADLGLTRSTVHGLLRSLQAEGLVEQDQDSRKYRLGPAVLRMGSSYLDGNELRAHAMNWADTLAARTGAAVRIGMLHDRHVLIVHHVFRPDDTLQSLDVGRLLPAHASALGRVLLAEHRYLAPTAGTEPVGVTGDLERDLDAVAERGWAGVAGELIPWEAAIAAPIRDRRGTAVGAIGISGPTAEIMNGAGPRDVLVGEVVRCAWAISRELGALPW